jgi:hypothetical protein
MNEFVEILETHFEGLGQNVTLLGASIQIIYFLLGFKGRTFKL